MIFAAAKPEDTPGIEALLAETDMPGWISLSYRADLANLAGHPDGITQTAIAKDGSRIVATATCTTLPTHQGPVAWIGGLRIAASHRKRAGLMRNGLGAIREHLLGDPPDWQMAAVLKDNLPAQGLLHRRSDTFPTFTPIVDFTTFAIRAGGKPQPGARAATPDDARTIAARLARETRPLAPVIDVGEDFADWRGLSISDFHLAEVGAKITGCAALWDQRDSRSFVVTDYARTMKALRPIWNLASPATGQPRLPPVGASLKVGFVSFLSADDPDTAMMLIRQIMAEAAERGLEIVNIGLAVDDPLHERVARSFRHQTYVSTLYGVTWPEGRRLPPPAFFTNSKVELSLL